MSFILDALKKSETERQQQGGAEFSTVPTSSPKSGALRWLWLLGLLLAINVAVLLGLLLQRDDPPDATTTIEVPDRHDSPIPSQAAVPAEDTARSFAEQVAEARQEQPPAQEPADAVTPQPTATPAPITTRGTSSGLPTIDQLRLDGSLQLTELHVDIHVYSDTPGERFVFINMVKHREGSLLDEGPVVTEITTDGVILKYDGRSFLLPRE